MPMKTYFYLSVGMSTYTDLLCLRKSSMRSVGNAGSLKGKLMQEGSCDNLPY
jgi:hypothetical protein